jgi:serine/threonine protein kinase
LERIEQGKRTQKGKTVPQTQGTIDSSEITKKEEVGKGHFSKVYRGVWKGTMVAIKELNTEEEKQALDELEVMRYEQNGLFFSFFFFFIGISMRCLKNLKRKIPPHRNIVQVLGTSYMHNKLCIVMEFIKAGNLEDLLKAGTLNISDSATLLKILLDISTGMEWLHQNNIIHRDLASR